MKEFKVNDYITLKLEEGGTNIYVNGELFDQCKFLLLNIPVNEVHKYDEIVSIDEAADVLGWTEDGQENIPTEVDLSPETEFWGHCSNLQAWSENNYDTRILHRNLAFPLLKALADAGDPVAQKVFKDEITKRLESGYLPVINYLIEEDEIESMILSIRKEGFPSIMAYLSEKGTYLKYFNMEEISSIFERFKELGIEIFTKLKLTKLYLKTLPEVICQLSSLKTLHLEMNNLSTLPESIGNLLSLEKLILWQNLFTTFPEAILNLTSLKDLDLSSNQLTTIPESIGQLTSLKKLTIRINELTTLPESIGNLKSLKCLNLENNRLSALPESIKNLKSLKSLDLTYNQLTIIPEFIGQLTSLKSLDLTYNQLTIIPEFIDQLTSLENLYLSNNNLRSLPESIGNLTSLENLYVRENQLTTLPESISNLTSLKRLDLRINQLTSLPESIGNLTSLKDLHLGTNQLTTLPESITNLTSLGQIQLYFLNNPLSSEAKILLNQLRRKRVLVKNVKKKKKS